MRADGPQALDLPVSFLSTSQDPKSDSPMRMQIAIALMLLFAGFFFAGSILGSIQPPPPAPITFSKDIAPIFYKHCVACHRPGDIAPMSLLTYKDAKPLARLIADRVTKLEMPPWHADSRFGEFANDRRLSQEDIRKIVAWVAQGAREGSARELPPVPKFAEQWTIGQPDVVLKMPQDYAVGPEVSDQYMYFRIPTNFSEDKWIQAVEFRPGNRKIVHHAVAFIETPESFAEAQRINPSEKSESPAWSLLETKASPLEVMDGTTRRIKPDAPVVNDGCSAPDVDAVGFSSNNSVLSVYAPGRGTDVWPLGTAKKIPAGSNIILQMHYSKPAGTSERDQTSVALIFAKAAVEKVVVSRSVSNFLFEIPPRAVSHKVTACWNVQRNIEFLSFMPHMHVRGKSMQYEVVYPGGAHETLLSVPHYSFHWQTLYALRTPLAIPGGSRLIVTAQFDNSEGNMHNPDPSKSVRHGTATSDEMMIGFVDYVIPKPRERVIARINPKVYADYVGLYEVAPGATLSVSRVEDRLYAESGGQRLELYPISETVFFSRNTESELTFVRNEKGEVTGFIVTQNDKLVTAKRMGKVNSLDKPK